MRPTAIEAVLGEHRVEEFQRRDGLAVTISEFLAVKPPARRMLIEPFLPEGGLAMIHAWTGVGKTHVAVGVAQAGASGGSFLRWQAPRPIKVLYVDGEMPVRAMWDRLSAAVAAGAPIPSGDYFRLITPDRLPDDMPVPNLRKPEGQALIEPDLADRDLVIFDNIATLFRDEGDQNAAGGWIASQDYILGLRRRGKAVLLVDHDNKSGSNRGTSAKHDVLDTVIHLKQPGDYRADQGARFEVHYPKHRGFFGRDAMPFEAQLIETPTGPAWTVADSEAALLTRLDEMVRDRISERDMRAELGIGGSKLARLKKLLETGAAQ
jgi:putative DNA primase/helicase